MTTLASALLCISIEAHVVLATPGPLRLEVRLPPPSQIRVGHLSPWPILGRPQVTEIYAYLGVVTGRAYNNTLLLKYSVRFCPQMCPNTLADQALK